MRRTSLRGFTLIELIIVISIIMILAVMGAGAYSVGRRIAIIDLHAEKLASLLHSYRDKTQAGNATGVPTCEGLIFQRAAEPQKVVMPYLDASTGRSGCDKTAQTNQTLEWQDDVVVKSITVSGHQQNEALPLIFMPPNGDLAPIAGINSNDQNSEVIIQIEYKDRTRTIVVSEASGSIEKRSE